MRGFLQFNWHILPLKVQILLSNQSLTWIVYIRDDQSYEDPLKKIFNLVCGMSPLTEIFVDLLPETFT